jgi:hypothetical protein
VLTFLAIQCLHISLSPSHLHIYVFLAIK